MGKKGIYIFLAALGIVIVAVIVSDFAKNRPGKRPSNPFAYDLETIKNVEPDQVLYRETRNLKLNLEELRGVAWHNGRLYVAGDQSIQVIGTDGLLLLQILLPEKPFSIAASHDRIYAGLVESVLVYNQSGELVQEWKDFSDNSFITSIAVYEDKVFVADAGRRRVYRYSNAGEKMLEFEGKVSDDVAHGFIVPSGYFDVAVNEFGDLWVANPGKHALENYTFEGILRGFWTASFADVKGFTGCCNPSHFTFLPGGNFITSEKGVLRVKEYKPSGEFVGVVAPPSRFLEEGNVSDVTADSEGRVYVCDPDKKSIRIFEKI